MREFYVYILTNKWHNVLYTGVTGNLYERVQQHRSGHGGKFTTRYKVNKLVYVEVFSSPLDAIDREKQIKAGSRQDKLDLIYEVNPAWNDLLTDWIF
jgi:putative endonuclease